MKSVKFVISDKSDSALNSESKDYLFITGAQHSFLVFSFALFNRFQNFNEISLLHFGKLDELGPHPGLVGVIDHNSSTDLLDSGYDCLELDRLQIEAEV